LRPSGDGFAVVSTRCAGTVDWPLMEGDCKPLRDSRHPLRGWPSRGVRTSPSRPQIRKKAPLRGPLLFWRKDGESQVLLRPCPSGNGLAVVSICCAGMAGGRLVEGDCEPLRDSRHPLRGWSNPLGLSSSPLPSPDTPKGPLAGALLRIWRREGDSNPRSAV